MYFYHLVNIILWIKNDFFLEMEICLTGGSTFVESISLIRITEKCFSIIYFSRAVYLSGK